MKILYTKWHIAAILGGALCIFSDGGSNVQNQYEMAGTLLDSNIAIIVAVGIAGYVASGCLGQAIAQRSYVSAAILLIFTALASCASLAYTIDRVAKQRADAQEARAAKKKTTAKHNTVTQELFATASRKVAEYCVPLSRVRRRSRDEFQQQCREWRDTLERERTQLRHEAGLIAPPASGDTLGPNVARFLEIISGGAWVIRHQDVGVVVNMLFPAAVLFGGLILTGFGARGQRIQPEFDFAGSASDQREDKAQRYIVGYVGKHGKAPTVGQIQEVINVSQHVAQRMRRQYGKVARQLQDA